MSEKLLTIREVAYLLGISEKEVIDLSDRGVIPAYKVAGVYLRFKKDQIEQYKFRRKDKSFQRVYTFRDGLHDFFYFYDFYIISVVLIVILFWIIVKG